MEMDRYVNTPDLQKYFLSDADRALALKIDLRMPSPTASTCIFKYGSHEKQPGTTTKLYQEVLLILQRESSQIGKPIKWTLLTSNPAMREWIQSPNGGLRVVGRWDETINTKTETFAIKYVDALRPLVVKNR